MDYHEQFRRAAAERGISEHEVGRFAEFLRFAIRTSRHPDGVAVGRLGGLPRLPVGMEWPTSGDGWPLPFIASFDCAALPQVDSFALPVDGSLLFFLHREFAFNAAVINNSVAAEQEYARVVYVPAGIDTARAEAPANLAVDGPEHDLFATVTAELPYWLDGFDDYDLDPSRTDNGEHLARDLPHLEQLCALAKELWPRRSYAAVRLGGFAGGSGGLVTDYMEETPETIMAGDILEAREKAGDIVTPPAEWSLRLEEETLRVMREWMPLAQFAKVDAYWGCFLIHRDDLAAARFDKAISRTEFTE